MTTNMKQFIIAKLAAAQHRTALLGFLKHKMSQGNVMVTLEIDPYSSVWRFTVIGNTYGYNVGLTDDHFNDCKVRTVRLAIKTLVDGIQVAIEKAETNARLSEFYNPPAKQQLPEPPAVVEVDMDSLPETTTVTRTVQFTIDLPEWLASSEPHEQLEYLFGILKNDVIANNNDLIGDAMLTRSASVEGSREYVMANGTIVALKNDNLMLKTMRDFKINKPLDNSN